MRRRDFLKAAAAIAPALWLPRRAWGRTAARGRVKHLLVLNAKGGLRSHALFDASTAPRHNPWGTQPSPAEWALGAACGSEDIVTPSGTLEAFAKRTQRVAVLAAVDHTPNDREPDVDHDTAARRIGTGAPNGTTGLLTLIGRHHPRYANGFSLDAVPPVEITASTFGAGGGDLARFRPISVDAPAGGGDDGDAEPLPEMRVRGGWSAEARDRLNRRFLERTAPAYASRIDGFVAAKRTSRTFASLFADPRLDVLGAPESEADGVSNQRLIEVLGRDALGALGDSENSAAWGPRVALALRFFGFGSPACVVTHDIYDMHDDERTNFAPRAQDLVRQLAGLDELLHAMPHPTGGTYWDHTLVAVVSEFSRNNTGDNGFNSGAGSDHVVEASAPCRNQAIAVMGGPVTAGGVCIGATDSELVATGPVFSSRSLLATFLDVLGIEPGGFFTESPIEELFS